MKEEKLSEPTPLVVHGILKEHEDIVKNIRDRKKGKFHIKYGYKNTKIQTFFLEIWKTLPI